MRFEYRIVIEIAIQFVQTYLRYVDKILIGILGLYETPTQVHINGDTNGQDVAAYTKYKVTDLHMRVDSETGGKKRQVFQFWQA